MRPLTEWPVAERASLEGVLLDIDDTLTTDGRLTAAAYAAMEALHRAALTVVPITGRPAGWCDHIARMWPVHGVVGENGAFYFSYDDTAHRMERHYIDDAATRTEHRRRLAVIGAEIVARVHGSAVAADQSYRETDLAIDYCEDVERLPASAVGEIVALMEARGLSAKVSSIHVNGWFGRYDKLAMTQRFLSARCGSDARTARQRYAFIGDSPNDEPMFAFFESSVGVANVRDFADRIEDLPRYITSRTSGAGFSECAEAILAARSSQ